MNRTRIVESRIESLASTQRLDEYCANRFTYLSRERWRREIAAGTVSLNGLVASDAAVMISGGELLAWKGFPTTEPEIDDRITVLFADDWFVAVDKTGNLPVHPGGRYFNNTLVRLWEERCGRKIYPVHRLDRETSGIVVSAFDGRTAGRLSAALAAGAKEYLALVHGCFPEEEMTVDLPLGRAESAVAKKRRAWPGGGEKAVTRFRKVRAAGDISLVRCFPETGRLHQIRTHLLAAGFPIVGDKLYGRDENAFLEFIKTGLTAELQDRLVLPRQALHASRLVFTHPFTQKETIIHSPLPKMFAELLREKENRRLSSHADSVMLEYPPLIVAPSTNVTFSAAGQVKYLDATVSGDWFASSDQAWCQAVPATGKGDNPQVSITVSANTTERERKATVTFATKDGKEKDRMIVTQSQY